MYDGNYCQLWWWWHFWCSWITILTIKAKITTETTKVKVMMTYNDNPKSCGFSDLLFEEFYKGKVLCQSRSTLCRVEEMQHLGLKDSSSGQRTAWSWLSQSMQSWIMTAHCHFFNYHGDDTDLTMTRSKYKEEKTHNRIMTRYRLP